MCCAAVQRVFIVIIVIRLMTSSTSITYYVTPTENSKCPEEAHCHTLSAFATNTSNYFDLINITLVLLPGNHSLDSELCISDIPYLSISVDNTIPSATTTITCSQSAGFHFESIKQITISNLSIVGCINNIIESVDCFTLENCCVNGQKRDGSALILMTVNNAIILKSLFSLGTGVNVSHPLRLITTRGGGAIHIIDSNVLVSSCNFHRNAAGIGGAIFCLKSYLTVNNCNFTNNNAITDAGAVYTAATPTKINGSRFIKNVVADPESASFGGAVEIFNSTSESSIDNCFFKNNSAGLGGGAIDLFNSNQTHYMRNNEFVGNSAPVGSAIIIQTIVLETSGYLFIHGNQQGTVSAFNCQMTFSGNTIITNNTHTNSSKLLQDGGAISCFQTSITFRHLTTITYNKGKLGGAISATECKMRFEGSVSISHNSANESGGGFHTYFSEFSFYGKINIIENSASTRGGGIYSVDSTVRLGWDTLNFTNNCAKEGGGIFLADSKLQIFKTVIECEIGNFCQVRDPNKYLKLVFVNNSAEYGGALFVADETISSTCDSRTGFGFSECFLQSIAIHEQYEDYLNILNTYFSNNTATIAGNTLYGGLLDRCTVSSYAEIFRVTNYTDLTPDFIHAVSYILNITNLKREELQSEISSDPVQVCFCENDQPDCSYEPPAVHIKKGETFNITLVAVDQVNNIIPNTIIHNPASESLELGDGCSTKSTINYSCTSLSYNVFSPKQEEQLRLYASGPCQDSGISERNISIKFKACPIGFQDSLMECKCDPILFPEFVVNCSIDNESVTRKKAAWISLLNSSEEYSYITYQNCPFDYCHPPEDTIYVDLNVPNGADAICTFNRSGILCGECKDGTSLLLGSSHCGSCSNNGVALLIVFAIAGIALVVFLLVFNLTVAVGTINGLIFYANIIAANSTLFFPVTKANVLSIFIAWLNLDFGFETCFYAGLDGYAKTWLQFLFPVYILLLVIGIVIACEYFPRFALLLSNRNPVATLATLILLSYTKLLRVVIASLSLAVLLQHTGDDETKTTVVWLIDGNIGYFQGKHVPLFITALFILVLGLVYTLLVLMWQWVQRLPNKKGLRWTRNAKLNSLMEVYHIPYKRHHRYWTGLLLLVRAVLYLVAALNVVSDPSNTLFSTASLTCALILLKEIPKDKVYREWVTSTLESSFLFNIVIFATATLYIHLAGGNQAALAYTSISIAFVTFIIILVYHTIESFKPLKKVVNKLKLTKMKTIMAIELKSINLSARNEQSTEFNDFRKSMEIFDDELIPDIAESLSCTPSDTAKSLNVTCTVIDPIPSDRFEDI